MTTDQKLCYSEGMLWRNQVKSPSLTYAHEVVNEDPYSLIPEDAQRSLTYHQNRVRVSQTCLAQPDMFAQQNAGWVALAVSPDPVDVIENGIKGAIVALWVTLAGGIPPPPPPGPEAPEDVGRADRDDPPGHHLDRRR